MKAWEISTYYSADYWDLVFADTRNKAITKVLSGKTALDSVLAYGDSLEYTDIRAVRAPELDNCENKSDMQIMELLILKRGWDYYDASGKYWSADNFDKKEFEKEWLENEVD